MKLKRINSKDKYQALLKVIFSKDLSSKDSIMRTLLINKVINHLYIKSSDIDKKNLLDMLKRGINEEVLAYIFERLDKNDLKIIGNSLGQEFAEIVNYSLIKNTNGTRRP